MSRISVTQECQGWLIPILKQHNFSDTSYEKQAVDLVLYRVKELEQKLAEASGVIRFYGDTKNWGKFTDEYSEYDYDGGFDHVADCAHDVIADNDLEYGMGKRKNEIGGKRAREFLAKLEEGKE